jgi:hypothetical protein
MRRLSISGVRWTPRLTRQHRQKRNEDRDKNRPKMLHRKGLVRSSTTFSTASVKIGLCGDVRCTAAFPPKAEVRPRSCYVANVPEAEVATICARRQLSEADVNRRPMRRSPRGRCGKSSAMKGITKVAPSAVMTRGTKKYPAGRELLHTPSTAPIGAESFDQNIERNAFHV